MTPAADLHIAVFAKPLIPGRVKTRLIPSVGAERAANIQRAMLWRTMTVAQDVVGEKMSLWVEGAPDHPTLQPLRDAFAPAMRAQRGEDLGARMRFTMAILLQAHSRVLLVGGDCPVLSATGIQAAAAALDDGDTDAVFIPVEDGGYVLIGLRSGGTRRQQLFEALFEGIPWGTERVMAQTRARLVAARLRWSEQPMLWDVDRPEDLRRANAHDLL